MTTKTLTFILVPVSLLLLGGAFWIGLLKGTLGSLGGDGSSPDSPIVVADGSSIHFKQAEGWNLLGPSIYVDESTKRAAFRIRIGYCSASDGDESKCDKPAIYESNPHNHDVTLYLCSDNSKACNSSYFSGILQLPKKTDGGSFVSGNSSTSFVTSDLLDVYQNDQLKYIGVQLDGGATTPVDCSASNPASKPCVIRVCYAGGPNKCK
jgi:hypothetical protein